MIITIGRTFGAGARELGHILADKLNINYYDKELLSEAAKRAGLHAGLFEHNDERAPGLFAGMLPISMSYNVMSWYGGGGAAFGSEAVYRAQAEFINHLADEESCVIVGRTADYILRDRSDLLSVFLHAPEDVCVKRIVERSGLNEAEARQIMRRTNRLRAEFYNFYTGRQWGSALTYDLAFDTSKLSLDRIASMIIEIIGERKA